MPEYKLDYFFKKSWSFVLIRGDKIIYKSKSQGLAPLVFCLKKYRKQMRGAIIYDKIIGLAAAKLLVYGNVAEVLTPTISRDAKKYLQKNKVKLIFKKEVKNILNRDGNDLCPMERISRGKGIKELCRVLRIV